jgi:hypothetical protein
LYLFRPAWRSATDNCFAEEVTPEPPAAVGAGTGTGTGTGAGTGAGSGTGAGPPPPGEEQHGSVVLVEAKQVSPNGHSALVEQLVPHLESASAQSAPQRLTAQLPPLLGAGTGAGTVVQ